MRTRSRGLAFLMSSCGVEVHSESVCRNPRLPACRILGTEHLQLATTIRIDPYLNRQTLQPQGLPLSFQREWPPDSLRMLAISLKTCRASTRRISSIRMML